MRRCFAEATGRCARRADHPRQSPTASVHPCAPQWGVTSVRRRRKDPLSISLLVLSQTSTGKVSTTRVQKRTLVHAHDKV
jgi:hypothetical protein